MFPRSLGHLEDTRDPASRPLGAEGGQGSPQLANPALKEDFGFLHTPKQTVPTKGAV
jgi:hypothetical protein